MTRSFLPLLSFVFLALSLLAFGPQGAWAQDDGDQNKAFQEMMEKREKMFADPNIKIEKSSVFVAKMTLLNIEQNHLLSGKCQEMSIAAAAQAEATGTPVGDPLAACFCANFNEMYNFQLERYSVINDFIAQRPHLKGAYFAVEKEDGTVGRIFVSPEEQQPPLPIEEVKRKLRETGCQIE